jgi:hypothetical protein
MRGITSSYFIMNKTILRILCLVVVPAGILCATSGKSLAQTINTSTVSGSPFAPGASVSVPYTITGSFTAGNVFTAQLSDASGSFSSPTTIGTVTATTAGSIAATMPTNLKPAAAYRIRVVSATPAVQGADNGTNLGIGHNALAFPGSGAYLTLPGTFSSNFADNNITIEGWFYNVATNSEPVMLFGESFLGDGNIKFMIYQLGSSIYGGFYNGGFVQASATFNTGTWTHVAASYDKQSIKLYINGNLANSTATTLALPTGNEEWRIGRRWDYGQTLNGRLDDFSVWNRALCQAEIQAHMAGELPSPSTQTGLVAYFPFDQGIPSGSNTGIASVTDESGKGNTATFVGTALTGSTSNFVTGATGITQTGSAYTPSGIGTSTELVTKTISGATAISGCGTHSNLTPTGTTTALSGSVTSRLLVDASVSSYNGQAYVQRHHDILPAVNASTATANITLYYTQAEFTAFNASRGSLPSLPVDATDAANYRSNLRISQFHGTPTGGYNPANYPTTWSGSGPARVLITPSSVAYNATTSVWEVSFPVTGFSGFFASTNSSAPLPVRLVSFQARPEANAVLLHWSVAEQKDMAAYTVERSTDGKTFSSLSTVDVAAAQSSYSTSDLAPTEGDNYYRLRMVGTDGSGSYSNVEHVRWNKGGIYFRIGPLPAAGRLDIETNDISLEGTTAVLLDMSGSMVQTIRLNAGRTTLSLESLHAGIYTLRLVDGRCFKLVKI